MDTVLDRHWTTETFLAWEDHQEGKHEFDGFKVVPMTCGSFAHQDIVFNLRVLLARLLAGSKLRAVQEMRLRIGSRIRYPDVLVCAGKIDQTVRTVNDAVVIFEVLSDDTAATDSGEKLIDYAAVPTAQYYVILEQTCRRAIVYARAASGGWTDGAPTEDAIALPGLDLLLPLADIYHGLSFPPPLADRAMD